MRITKKFTGGECIGKQVFRPVVPSMANEARMKQVQIELAALEKTFLRRVQENPQNCISSKENLCMKRKFKSKAGMSAEDTRAARLLLGFFHGAQGNEVAMSPCNKKSIVAVEDKMSPDSSRKLFTHGVNKFECNFMKRPSLDSMTICNLIE
jgi:hypothetical protein